MSNWVNASMCREIALNEGGLVDNPADSGGITNFGISLNFAKGFPQFFAADDVTVVADDIRSMPIAKAMMAYMLFFFHPAKLDSIQEYQTQGNILMQIFDLVVNSGVNYTTGESEAIKVLQHALGCFIDGMLGPETVTSLASAVSSEGTTTVNNMIADARDNFYDEVVEAHPEDAEFLEGWKRRADKYRI